MPNDVITRVAVVGAGTLGAQIAALCAAGGAATVVTDVSPEALERARGRIGSELLPAIAAAGMGTRSAAEAFAGLAFEPDVEAAVRGVDLVVEAVKEDAAVKTELFGRLSRANPTAILATNSSSIPSSRIVGEVADPSRVCNAHFFGPIWVRTMVELMSCGATDPAVLDRLKAFTDGLGLVTAIVRTESKGFIINRIWRAVKRESLAVVDQGVAEPEDVDRLWRIFFQTDYPPFGVMDMVGLDVVRDIETSYQRESLDPTDVPSATLERMIGAGLLGEKTGRGFYAHPDPAYLRDDFVRPATAGDASAESGGEDGSANRSTGVGSPGDESPG